MFDLFYKWMKRLLLAATGTTVVLAANVVPVEMQWAVSYETVKFDTHDGDLGLNQYAVKNKNSWYVREVPKNRGNFTSTSSLSAIKGKEKVNLVCVECAYYSEFLSRSGKRIRVRMNKQRYNALRTIQDASLPSNTERVSILSANQVEGAIEHDNSTDSGMLENVSSASWSHTVSGDDRLLAVGVHIGDSDGAGAVSDVTYNGSSITNITSTTTADNVSKSEIWYTANPATGSNTVSVSVDSTMRGLFGGATSFTGAKQSSQPDASVVNTGNGTEATTTITTTEDDVYIFDAISAHNGSDCQEYSANSSQTERATSTGNQNLSAGESTRLVTSASSYDMNWTVCDFSVEWAHSVVSFAAASSDSSSSQSGATSIDNGSIQIKNGKMIID